MVDTGSLLKTKSGSYLQLRHIGKETRLMAKGNQNVKPVRIREQSTWLALSLQHGGKNLLLKVVGKELKLEDDNDQAHTDLNDDYWFQRVDVKSGEYFGLKTVTSNLYISLKGPEGQVTLSEDKVDMLYVKHEGRNPTETPRLHRIQRCQKRLYIRPGHSLAKRKRVLLTEL